MVKLGSVALELTPIEPLKFPEVGGANATPKVALAPALSESGRFNPVMLNPVPVTTA
jgi:hypothetical protein